MRTVWVPKNAKLKPFTKVEDKSPKGQKQNKHTQKNPAHIWKKNYLKYVIIEESK